MDKRSSGLSEMLAFYHATTDLLTATINNTIEEKSTDFIKHISKLTQSCKAILISNKPDKLTVYDGQLSYTKELPELIDALPLLYQSFACTKLEPFELTLLLTALNFENEPSYIQAVFFSFEINQNSLCFVLFRSEEQGPYSDLEYETIDKISRYIEDLVHVSLSTSQGKQTLEKLESQQNKQRIWLESLAWLNDVNDKNYSNKELNELYKTSLFQLKLLVKADCATAIRVTSNTDNLKNPDYKAIVSYEDIAFTENLLNIISENPKLEGFAVSKHSNLKSSDYQPLQNIGICNAFLFPLHVGNELKMILCIGNSEKNFDHDEEMITTLFAEGVEHLIERVYFLRAIKSQNSTLLQEKSEQEKLIAKLQEAQEQLLQQEKMASIGQLAAGVAHEINNPVGYVNSNINSLDGYITDLYKILAIYEKFETELPEGHSLLDELKAFKEDIDYNFIRDDVKDLISESTEGVLRVKQIVKDLKDFSHVDEAEWQCTNLESGINSTLNIVHNELKYKVTIEKDYGKIPDVECVPSQINQVIMNLLVNAGHAIKEHGSITIRTRIKDENFVYVEIADTGKGIAEENLNKIFDPFFTTKPVGEGTGLGLSLSYSIIEKHGGELSVESKEGVGTTFRITLPMKQESEIK